MIRPPDGSLPARSGNPADWLDLYIDGLLDDAGRQAFEAELARNADLRAQLALQGRIDSGLKAGCAIRPDLDISFGSPARAEAPETRSGPASASAIPAPAQAGSVPARARSESLARLKWYVGVAAVLMLGALVFRQYVGVPSEVKYIDPESLYTRLELGGFEPEFVCKDDAEFVAAVVKRLGSGLLVTPASGLTVLGWAYGKDYEGRIIGPDTLVLMVKVSDPAEGPGTPGRPPGSGPHHVLVLMDRTSSDRALPTRCEKTGLRLFRREVGPLVLYEVTPLNAPSVLDKVRAAGG